MTRKDTATGDLFAVPQPAPQLAGSQDYRVEVALMVGDALKRARGDRFDVAARMGRLMGKEVSKYMLDAWSSEARDAYNIPFYAVPVLEVACDVHDFANWHAAKIGGRLYIGRDALTAELGKLEQLRDEAGQRIADLKRRLRGNE